MSAFLLVCFVYCVTFVLMSRKSPLFVLFLTIFIDLLGFGILIPILPIYIKELGYKADMAGLVIAIYSVMNFVFGPVWGMLSDRFGRRPVMLMSIAITAVSYVFLSQATTFLLVFLARFLAGIGSANISTAQAYITDITTPANRAKALGLIGAAFGIGFVIGPPVGGTLKQHMGMEWVGWVPAILCSINLVMAFFLLPESLSNRNKDLAFRFNPIADLARELRRPQIRELFWLNFLYITAFSIITITVALFWKEHHKLADDKISYTFALMGLVSAVVQGGLIGKLSARWGEQRLMQYGIVSMIVGSVLIPLGPVGWFFPIQPLAIGLLALGTSLLTPSIASLVSQAALPHERGQLLGSMQSFASLARAVGPAIGGVLYTYAFYWPYVGAVVFLGFCWFITQTILKLAYPAQT